MKFLKYLVPLVTMTLTMSSAFSQNLEDPNNVDADDSEVFRAFIEEVEDSKFIPGTRIKFGGDVRVKYFHERKTTNGFNTRGSDARNPIEVLGAKPNGITLPVNAPLPNAPSNSFEIDANLDVEYDGKRDWMEIRTRFRTNAGVYAPNTATSVKLTRAWMGYMIYDGCLGEVYVEGGRYGMDDLFESKVQFDSTFDGILLTYSKKFCHLFEFYTHGGPFVINYSAYHIGWVGEVAFVDILDSGWYAKYSFIDWRKRGGQTYTGRRTIPADPVNIVETFDVDIRDNPLFRFQNSQFLMGYIFSPCHYFKRARVFAAYLVNHAAKRTQPFLPEKNNSAWYVGADIGKLEGKGDWLVELCYQSVGYLAIPHFDVAGISRGNKSGADTEAVVNPSDPNLFVDPSNVQNVPFGQLHGNANYKGWVGRGYFLLTDQITLKTEFRYSTPLNRSIGGEIPLGFTGKPDNRFRKFELSAIYAF